MLDWYAQLAGTNANDENMLVIRNGERVADIYLSEFMGLYTHHAFRESVARWQQQGAGQKWQPNDLVPDARQPTGRRGRLYLYSGEFTSPVG